MPCTPRTEGEILLRRFLFNELKTATWNFHPDNMVGVGGFGRVFKGWVDHNSSTAAKPGCGMLIAVKTIHQEGFQGQEEWLVSFTYIYPSSAYMHFHYVLLIRFWYLEPSVCSYTLDILIHIDVQC